MTEHQDELHGEDQDDAIIGVALRWSALALVIIVIIVAAILYFNREKEEAENLVVRDHIEAPKELAQGPATLPSVRFEHMKTGVAFEHFNGARGQKLLPETMGGGVAVLDYDNDGDQDLFFVNSTHWPQDPAPAVPATQKLYRNDGEGNFEDVTKAAGLAFSLPAFGVACGDVDGDGDVDLFLAALGENRLLRNTGSGFEDATGELGLSGSRSWSTSAGFLDYDKDGDLDLFVCNYIGWNRELDLQLNFTLNGRDRAYGPPKQYPGVHSYLYRNDDGKFVEVGKEAGIQVANPATGTAMGKALAVTFADPDQDGYPDIMVANDTVQNFLFRNKGDGTFEELGTMAGFAFDSMGSATGAMGMDVGHFANDARLGVSIANFANESTSLYVQQPKNPWQFADMANSLGIGSPSRLKLSFGLFFFDYDLDGRLDLLQANGHLEEEINNIQASQHYRQATQLFWNTGGTSGAIFTSVPEDDLGDLAEHIVGRGAAYGDLDGDGDLDLVLTQSGGPALVLRNNQNLGHHWLRVQLRGKAPNTEAIGAMVSLQVGDKTQRRYVMPTRSYLSQVELPLTFGLGSAESVDSLAVTWPDGTTKDYEVTGVDQMMEIRQ